MRSSTSSSEYGAYYCSRFFLLSVLITTLLLLASWEVTLRSLGFRPSVRDSDVLWAQAREKAIAQQAALVGASKFTAAMDPESLKSMFDGKVPAQLSLDGGQVLLPFFDLADDPQFRGIVLLSVVPGAFFQPFLPWQEELWKAKFDCYRKCAVVSKIEHHLRLPLQEMLALYAPETTLSVNLQHLLGRKMVFPGVVVDTPWAQQALFQRDRTKKPAHPDAQWEESRLNQLKDFWPYVVEQWDAPWRLTDSELTDHFSRIQAAIDKITARGGEVIILRMHSSGKLEAIENTYYPRNEYWERLTSLRGTLTIHYNDYPELAEFKTIDDSHLSPMDAPDFSRALAELVARLRSEGLGQSE